MKCTAGCQGRSGGGNEGDGGMEGWRDIYHDSQVMSRDRADKATRTLAPRWRQSLNAFSSGFFLSTSSPAAPTVRRGDRSVGIIPDGRLNKVDTNGDTR